jgi:hypothetical protein
MDRAMESGRAQTTGVARFERRIEYFIAQFDELSFRYSHVSIGSLCIGSSIAIEIAARNGTVASLNPDLDDPVLRRLERPPDARSVTLRYYTPLRRCYRVRETDP